VSRADARSLSWGRFALELVAIMVSILAAFAVDQWWESRSDRHQEVLLLTALAEEFRMASVHLDEVRTAHTVVRDAQARLLELAERATPIPATEHAVLDTLVSRSFWRTFYEPPMGTLESILGSGALSRLNLQDLDKGFGEFVSLPWEQKPAAAHALVRDDRFRNHTYMHWVLQTNSLSRISRVEESLELIRALIAEDLGHRPLRRPVPSRSQPNKLR
jgi:hypothetical protein